MGICYPQIVLYSKPPQNLMTNNAKHLFISWVNVWLGVSSVWTGSSWSWHLLLAKASHKANSDSSWGSRLHLFLEELQKAVGTVRNELWLFCNPPQYLIQINVIIYGDYSYYNTYPLRKHLLSAFCVHSVTIDAVSKVEIRKTSSLASGPIQS